MTRPRTTFDLWRELRDSLRAGGVPAAEEEASRLVAEATSCDLHAIRWREAVAASEARAGRRMCDRRTGGTPIDFVVGSTTFCGLSLRVDERVIIPRQKTESLVGVATTILRGLLDRGAPVSFADVGTGCGAVVLALLARLPDRHPAVTAYALDCCPDALEVARENAGRLGLASDVQWLRGDLVDALPEPVHLMVVNLPYLPPARTCPPPRETRCEPAVAVFGGGRNGLRTLRRFLNDAPRKLRPDGQCVVEVPVDHAQVLCRRAQTRFGSVDLVADQLGVPRLLVVSRPLVEPA